ncbi:hypothetical protein ACFLVV_01295 [Chloroflexota bacterium]
MRPFFIAILAIILAGFVPRPELLGLFERITIYAYQLWIFILAYLLIKEQPEQVESGE